MKSTAMPATETTDYFLDLDEKWQDLVLAAHHTEFKNKGIDNATTLAQIFSVVNPKIVRGLSIKADGSQGMYCRIHEDSREIMVMTTKIYI